MNKGFIKQIIAIIVFLAGTISLLAVVMYTFEVLKVTSSQQGQRYAVIDLSIAGKGIYNCWIDLPTPDTSRCERVK